MRELWWGTMWIARVIATLWLAGALYALLMWFLGAPFWPVTLAAGCALVAERIAARCQTHVQRAQALSTETEYGHDGTVRDLGRGRAVLDRRG